MGCVHLWEVSPYRVCPLMGGVPLWGVHLWEVSPYGVCPLMGGVP